jgi:hypothetical protein
MSSTSTSDKVSMEFAGPVPAVLGNTAGYHVVFWVHAGGGAGFTRPSQEERDYYVELGKEAPEWQCEYFEFDDVTWAEAPLAVELWHGSAKLRSLFLAGRAGRIEAEVCTELPDLDYFLYKHQLLPFNMVQSFHHALLRAAEAAGVIKREATPAAPRANAAGRRAVAAGEPWWRGALRRAWPRVGGVTNHT